MEDEPWTPLTPERIKAMTPEELEESRRRIVAGLGDILYGPPLDLTPLDSEVCDG